MLDRAQLYALHEELPLEPEGPFEFLVDVERLGIDMSLLEPVVASGPPLARAAGMTASIVQKAWIWPS